MSKPVHTRPFVDMDDMGQPSRKGVNEILSYRPPVLRECNGNTYVEYYAFNPSTGKLGRCRIRLNTIKGVQARRSYARDLIKRLSTKLAEGWNPYLFSNTDDCKRLEEALDEYSAHLDHMANRGYYRPQTYASYRSYLLNFRGYVESHKPIFYVYQLDRRYLASFLDDIFVRRGNGATTRNNYLSWLTGLCRWLQSRGHLQDLPTTGLQPISKRLIRKGRELIPADTLRLISEWLSAHDPRMLLACHLLYYCFIRPQELCLLKVSDFNVGSSTVTLRSEVSKNKSTQSVTVPRKVMRLLVDSGTLSAPLGWYVFSEGLHPGPVQVDPVIFRHHWGRVRQALGFPSSYKFYSLKDTGITELADRKVSSIDIRDQARHSSLAITDIYTRRGRTQAVPEILDFDGPL